MLALGMRKAGCMRLREAVNVLVSDQNMNKELVHGEPR